MPDFIDLFDRTFRRNSLLPRMSWVRKLLRGPYHRLIGARGLRLRIGGAMEVRLPAAFCAKELEQYETETANAIRDWVDANPGGLFVDIGCSYGYFTCGVLFQDPTATVLGIDADLPSLAITKHVCGFAPNVEQRLELYRTLIGSESKQQQTANSLRETTNELLKDPNLKVDPGTTNYVNLDTAIDESELPRISLDAFLSERLKKSDAACMIKCDVEGAEQIVLEAAPLILKDHHPTILVSVHPPYLPKFGGSVEAIRKLLEDHGYEIDIIGIDHEEHWLCTAGS